MPPPEATDCRWLRTGDEVFPGMLAAMEAARTSIRLETYIFSSDELGRRFRDALTAAAIRGVHVQILLDAFGSQALAAAFWQHLVEAGGEVQWFNPPFFKRLGFRDHRKLLVCDEATAFVGGFNISAEYLGDGVKAGWCDLGLRVGGALAAELGGAFDDMFARAAVPPKPLALLRRTSARRDIGLAGGRLLLSGPGRGPNPFKRQLRRDLAHARVVRIIAAYFLPTRRIRRDLTRLARQGCRVQLILAAKSDVFLSQLAARSLYRRLLRAGVEIYEYQPQILHAKLIIVDEIVYAGSSNLDPRSLYLNYEVMLRLVEREVVAGARAVFEEKLGHCRRIVLEEWRKSRTWWRRLEQRWAYFLLVRVDPFIARWRGK